MLSGNDEDKDYPERSSSAENNAYRELLLFLEVGA